MSHHCHISASNSHPCDVPYYISFTSEEPYTSGYDVWEFYILFHDHFNEA